MTDPDKEGSATIFKDSHGGEHSVRHWPFVHFKFNRAGQGRAGAEQQLQHTKMCLLIEWNSVVRGVLCGPGSGKPVRAWTEPVPCLTVMAQGKGLLGGAGAGITHNHKPTNSPCSLYGEHRELELSVMETPRTTPWETNKTSEDLFKI